MNDGKQGRRRSGALMAGCLLLLAACGGGGGGGGGDGGGDGGAGPGTPPGPVDYFPLAVGHRWSYQGADGLTTVDVKAVQTANGRERFVLRSTGADGGEDELYEKTAQGVFLVAPPDADALYAALDGMPLLRLPLVAGRTETVVDRTLPGIGDLDGDGVADSIHVRVDSSTLGLETVDTPVGRFTGAARVRSVLTRTVALSRGNRRSVSTFTSDDWYAPGLGPVRSELTITDADGTRRETQALQAYRLGDRRSESSAPSVLSTAPAEAALTARPDAVRLVFSESMFGPSLEQGGFVLTGPDGQVVAGRLVATADGSGQVDGRSLAFLPADFLASGAYTATLTARAQDLAGNGLAEERSWRFTIDASGPQVSNVWPAAAADDVPVASSIRLQFDEPPLPASLPGRIVLLDELTRLPVPANVAVEGPTVMLTPQEPLLPQRQYRVEVYAGLSDGLGNATTQGWSSSFRTDPGRFGWAQTFDRPGAGVAYSAVELSATAASDADGDGRVDVWVVPGFVSNATGFEPPGTGQPPQPLVWIWRLQADGSLREPLRLEAPAGYDCRSPSLAVLDINGDGRLDGVAASPCGLLLWVQGSGGSFALQDRLPAPDGLLRVRAADMNGDGRTDLVGIGWSGSVAWLWLQRAEGGFAAPAELPVEYFGWTSLALGDYTGDGRPDLAIVGANTVDQALALLPQGSGGGWGPAAYAAVDPVWGGRGVAIGDITGDGRADVVAGNSAGAPLQAWVQRSDGTLAAPVALPNTLGGGGIVVADMDGDGQAELVVARGTGVTVYRRAGDGTWRGDARVDGLMSGSILDNPDALLVADINGDGLLDIVLGPRFSLQRPAAGSSAAVRPQAAGLAQRLQRAQAPATAAALRLAHPGVP